MNSCDGIDIVSSIETISRIEMNSNGSIDIGEINKEKLYNE